MVNIITAPGGCPHLLPVLSNKALQTSCVPIAPILSLILDTFKVQLQKSRFLFLLLLFDWANASEQNSFPETCVTKKNVSFRKTVKNEIYQEYIALLLSVSDKEHACLGIFLFLCFCFEYGNWLADVQGCSLYTSLRSHYKIFFRFIYFWKAELKSKKRERALWSFGSPFLTQVPTEKHRMQTSKVIPNGQLNLHIPNVCMLLLNSSSQFLTSGASICVFTVLSSV